ncbi:hypothetical protein KIN20_031280 [Parelaphostrongylus tenuis]|uniref:Uncharacterized protein n=1 Tax=Parelaphostrongylus tenuis TaxID=148309 RepID=A0AAD5R4X6_PARTN|nr:hypothetical protein KIN20_031280 [Parelaphostrongylus tenuis]
MFPGFLTKVDQTHNNLLTSQSIQPLAAYGDEMRTHWHGILKAPGKKMNKVELKLFLRLHILPEARHPSTWIGTRNFIELVGQRVAWGEESWRSAITVPAGLWAYSMADRWRLEVVEKLDRWVARVVCWWTTSSAIPSS